MDIMNCTRRAIIQASAAATVLVTLPRIFRTAQAGNTDVNLYVDDDLGAYGFPDDHPLGIDRQGAFLREADERGLIARTTRDVSREALREELVRFHSDEYVELVFTAEENGMRLLDGGDTPVFPGVYHTSAHVVGAALNGLEQVMGGHCLRSLQPIGGLHHAARGHAAGFCVFNDLGVVIETLRRVYGIRRVGYLDIDVHHGDGVFYAFEEDPDLIFADIHQDGRTLYPGTGRARETGKGSAEGTKLNIELAPFSGDAEFMEAWPRIEAHFTAFQPEFFIFQCGADGLKGDPLAQLEYSPTVHAHAAQRMVSLADKFAQRRIMAFGGGGYDRSNLAQAWSAVLGGLVGEE